LLQYCSMGVGDFVFMFDHPGDYRTLELLANEVAPRVRVEGSALLSKSAGIPASA
jgi:hypothetical protein